MERGQERARLVWWALPLPSSAAARILWFAAQRPMRSYPTDPFSSHLERACLLARSLVSCRSSMANTPLVNHPWVQHEKPPRSNGERAQRAKREVLSRIAILVRAHTTRHRFLVIVHTFGLSCYVVFSEGSEGAPLMSAVW